MFHVINSSKMNNLNLFKNFQGHRKIFRTTRCFSRIKDIMSFDSKFKDNSWRSRMSGNLTSGESSLKKGSVTEGQLFISLFSIKPHFLLKLWEPGYDIFVLWFQPKTSNFSCLTNALAPPPIVLESCLMAQTDRPT